MKYILADAIFKELKPIQQRRREFEENPQIVDDIILDHTAKCRQIAAVTMGEVKEKMGLS
jgi:tryptophanyl-tRNA synthetase